MFDEFRRDVPLMAVYWKDLRPGLVVAGGLSINGYMPPELAGFPVLDRELVRRLRDTYKLNPDKRILALGGNGDLSPADLSKALIRAQGRLAPLNALRKKVRALKSRQPEPSLPVWDSAWVERGTLIWPYRDPAPTLLAELSRDIGIASVISREVFTRFALPRDRRIALHLAVDFSYSMRASGKDEIARAAVGLFRDEVARVLPQAETIVYAFSDTCRVVGGELTGKEVERAGTDFSAFARAVLRRKRSDAPNALLVFTDGLPGKRQDALRALGLLGEAGIFYTQIVFNLAEDRRSYYDPSDCASLDGYYKDGPPELAREMTEDEYREQEERFRGGFLELARAASGNQLVIDVDDALGVAAVEVFDRWYGGLAN